MSEREVAKPLRVGSIIAPPCRGADDQREERMALKGLSRSLATGVAAGTLLFFVQPVSAANSGTVQGVVKNAAGQPVAGAFVRLRNAGKRLSFMVISQGNGSYTANNLPDGNYTVQGIEGTNQ